MKLKKITVTTAHGETTLDATDFNLMPTGHLAVIVATGVKNLDGTDHKQVIALFAPGAWASITLEDLSEPSLLTGTGG